VDRRRRRRLRPLLGQGQAALATRCADDLYGPPGIPPAAEDEAERFAAEVRADLVRQGVGYAELRSYASPRLAEVFAATGGPTMRLAVSLDRSDPWPGWDRVQALALGPHGAALTAVDFCGAEEGHPPKELAGIIAAVHRFNAARPDRALAVLVHVGESFADKSLESAVRSVQEAAEAGAHRLGHALALGLDPAFFGPHERREPAAERLDQIAYDLAHADGLAAVGIRVDADALRRERAALRDRPAAVVTVAYDAARLDEVRNRQELAMAAVRATGAVIEVCPTGNRRLLGLTDPADHPVHRFLAAGLPVVVATDNPGVFGTTLAAELDWVCTHTGGGEDLRRQLIETAWASRSEVLSGRPER
jgi:adenosine deaminase